MSVTLIDPYEFQDNFANSWSLNATAIPTSVSSAFLIRGGTYCDLDNAKWFVTLGTNQSNGSITNTYFYSTDGSSWSSGTFPANAEVRAIAGNGFRVVACSTNGGGGTSQAFVSTNGTTWTAYSLPSTSLTGSELLWDGTRFIYGTTDTGGNGLVHSVDGTSWTGLSNGGYSVNSVRVLNQEYYAFAGLTSRRCTSNPTVASNWENITMPASAQWITGAYGNNIYVALRVNANTYATSTNGTTWTSRTLPFTITTGVSPELIFRNGRFYIYQDGTVYSSTNGIDWTPRTPVFSTTLADLWVWISGPDRILGFGNNAAITGRAPDHLIGV